MYVIPLLNLLLTACMFAASRTVPRDIEKLRAWMKEAASGTKQPARAAATEAAE